MYKHKEQYIYTQIHGRILKLKVCVCVFSLFSIIYGHSFFTRTSVIGFFGEFPPPPTTFVRFMIKRPQHVTVHYIDIVMFFGGRVGFRSCQHDFDLFGDKNGIQFIFRPNRLHVFIIIYRY